MRSRHHTTAQHPRPRPACPDRGPSSACAPPRVRHNRIVPDLPLLVVGFDVYSGCLNTKGLEAAGIAADSPDSIGCFRGEVLYAAPGWAD